MTLVATRLCEALCGSANDTEDKRRAEGKPSCRLLKGGACAQVRQRKRMKGIAVGGGGRMHKQTLVPAR